MTEVVVVGGGQAGLAIGYHLARMQRDARRGRRSAAPEFIILDERNEPGGAWSELWPSMRLFSPASSSSLPGMRMSPSAEETATASEVVQYLRDYAERYALPISWGTRVDRVARETDGSFILHAARHEQRAQAVVMATGSWRRPFVPTAPGLAEYCGEQLHTIDYAGPEHFVGRRVAVVGGGNSGAQIAADLDGVAAVTWVTRRPPKFLPDEIDGRALFEAASKQAIEGGRGVGELGDIVAVPSVRAARDRGLRARWDLEHFTSRGVAWRDGSETELDAVIWCTGFRPDLGTLSAIDLARSGGIPATRPELPTASASIPGLYFLGYGDWCGAASATLVGVGRMARATAEHLDLMHRQTSI
ncbi:NAD(P)-binding domain-containing protein [Agrococcus sp. ARC_14]|uniref:NAD(P)-binding domain-containing protein n=1 Tax=Agrococcus sp. ARC_14 TaxID=2919927 RepID=UPI00321A7245